MATCDILLVSETEVKTLTSLTGNVDIKKFIHHIPIQQDLQIKTAIGTTCFNNLLDGVENDNLTALETTLLDGDNRSFKGVKMALAWWVLWASYPNLQTQVTAAGVGKKIGTGFEGATGEEMRALREQAKTYAEYYTDQLICYLCENEDSYPCVLDNDCACNDKIDHGYEASGIVLENDEFVRENPDLERVRVENRAMGREKTK